MRKEVLLAVVIFVLVCGLANAEFSVDSESSSVNAEYLGGDFVKGRVVMDLSWHRNAKFTSNFDGEISLLDLFKKMNYSSGRDFSCEPSGCRNSYLIGSSSDSVETSVGGDRQLYGFKLGTVAGNKVEEISEFNFDIDSNAGASCENQIYIDLFNDGPWDFYNTKSAGVACEQWEKNYGCFRESQIAAGSPEADISSSYYCEKIEGLAPAPGYEIGARVKKVSAGDGVQLSIFNPASARLAVACDTIEDNWLPSNEYANINCFVEFHSKDFFDAFVCIKRAGDGIYKIMSESHNACGGSVSDIYLMGDSRFSSDFEIYARPAQYASVGEVTFDKDLYSEIKGKSAQLIDDAEKYLEETYNSNCSGARGCVIPLSIWGNEQTVVLDSALVGYKESGIERSVNKIYRLAEEEVAITSEGLVLDIGKMKLKVPQQGGQHEFKLYFDGEEVISKTINIEGGFEFDIAPRLALLGQNIAFTVIVSEDIASSEWDFGDGSAVVESDNAVAQHIYTKEGEYAVEVALTNLGGEESRKKFRVIAGDARTSAEINIKKYKDRIKKIREKIATLHSWVGDEIKKALQIDALEGGVEKVEEKFNLIGVNATDEQYVEIINDLLAIDVPRSVSVSEEGSLPAAIGFGFINVGHIAGISGGTVGDAEQLKASVIAWIAENYDVDIEFETYSAIGEFDDKEILKKYKTKLTKKTGAGGADSFLIIGYPANFIVFKQNYEQNPVNDGSAAYLPVSADGKPENVEFLIAGANTPDIESLRTYISPNVELLGGGKKILPGFFEKEGKFNWGLFVVAMLFLLVLLFAAYIILQTWYKKYYEKHLFKNPDDLYNLINHVYNSRKAGVKDDIIKKGLRERKWKGEQITYAFKKIDGKRTGMWEIPVFKFIENRKVRREIEKRQGRPADARFIKRPTF